MVEDRSVPAALVAPYRRLVLLEVGWGEGLEVTPRDAADVPGGGGGVGGGDVGLESLGGGGLVVADRAGEDLGGSGESRGERGGEGGGGTSMRGGGE